MTSCTLEKAKKYTVLCYVQGDMYKPLRGGDAMVDTELKHGAHDDRHIHINTAFKVKKKIVKNCGAMIPHERGRRSSGRS